MIVVLIIIGIIALLFLGFYGNLLWSLLGGLRKSIRRGGMRAEIVNSEHQDGIHIRFDPGPIGRRVVVDAIILERAFAGSIEATPPEGFKERTYSLPEKDTFEGDLSVLYDTYKEEDITDEIIKKEIETQYQEAISTATEFNRKNVVWEGRFLVCPGKMTTIYIPAQIRGSTLGKILFTYKYRVGLWSTMSSGCSVQFHGGRPISTVQ